MFSYWPCYRFGGSRIGLRIAVLTRAEAEDQYSHPKTNTTARGQCENILFMTFLIFINQLLIFVFNVYTVESQ